MPRKIVARATEDDTEGHASRRLPKAVEDDTEGHASRRLPKAVEDDTEGHASRRLPKAVEDDTEGHASRRLPKAVEDDGDAEDTEGHSFIPDPLSSRLLAQAREREIQSRVRDRAIVKESRNPFRRSKG